MEEERQSLQTYFPCRLDLRPGPPKSRKTRIPRLKRSLLCLHEGHNFTAMRGAGRRLLAQETTPEKRHLQVGPPGQVVDWDSPG